MGGPEKSKAVPNFTERLSLLWFVKELARRLPKLRRYSPGETKTVSFEESPGRAWPIRVDRKALFAVVR
jgi:hypothetical protein